MEKEFGSGDGLTEFSRKVKRQFFETFPDLLVLEHKITESEGSFCVEIKAPSPNVEYPLIVDTDGEEVTIGFDAYHAHFYDFDGDSTYGIACEFIKEIIEDKHAVVSYWRDDKWCGSTFLPKQEFPIDNQNNPYANRIRIRSWLGSLDNEIIFNPRD